MAEVTPVEVGLLGPTRLAVGGAPVAVSTPRLRELLARLAIDVGRVVSVDRLVDDLWSGDPPNGAVGSLRSYVSNLRRVLDGAGVDGGTVLATSGRGYVLDLPADAVDVRRLDAAVAAGREAVGRGDTEAALTAFSGAEALWRGEPLADVHDRPFAQPEVSRLEELRRVAREERLQALLDAGRHAEAIPELEALVREDPARERPHAQLMLALYRAGRAADALHVHRIHRSTLVDEFGLDPGPEIEALADRILRQDPTLRRTPRVATPSAPPTRGAASSLVGRAEERALLAGAVEDLRAGRGGVLLLAGEPGIGKTALVEELAATAEQAGLPVHAGTCPETDGAPPLWPWREVVRSALAGGAADELASGDAAAVLELVGATPSTTAADPAGDVERARFALLQAVRVLLDRVAPAVVVLEDVHWADRDSLELLAVVGATARASGLLLVATHRDIAPDQTAELRAALAGLVRLPGARVVELRGLDEAGVHELLSRTLGHADPSTATDLRARTGGNPFFLHQLVSFLDAGGQRDDEVVPAGVRHVIDRRVAQMGDDVRRTLEAAAVVGREAALPVIAGMLDVPVASVAAHVDRAVAHGLLDPPEPGAATTRFVHSLVRETLDEMLGAADRMGLHASAARVLTSLHAAPDEVVAEHHWASAAVTDPVAAAEALRRAAAVARRLLALDRAEEHLRHALQLLDLHPGVDPRVELGVRLQLVHVLTSRRGWSTDEVAAIAGRVREIVDEAGIGPDLIPLWWALWNHHVTRGDLQTADQLAVQLQRDAESHDSPACRVAGHVASAVMHLHLRADAEGALDELAAARTSEALSPPERLAAAPEHLSVALRTTEAVARHVVADDVGARRAAVDAIDTARSLDSPFAEATAHVRAAWVAALGDDPDAAAEHAGAALALCERERFDDLADVAIPLHAWATARRGGPADQTRRASEAIARLRARGQVHLVVQLLRLAAETAAREGHDGDAAAHLAEARALARRTGDMLDRRTLGDPTTEPQSSHNVAG